MQEPLEQGLMLPTEANAKLEQAGTVLWFVAYAYPHVRSVQKNNLV